MTVNDLAWIITAHLLIGLAYWIRTQDYSFLALSASIFFF